MFGGLIIALILCGTPLAYMVFTGRFQQYTQPFANAAQTAAVVPVVSDTPTEAIVILATPTKDLSSLSYSERYALADPYISEALGNSLQGKPGEAIISWTKVLEIIPEDASSYRLRGEEYLKLLATQRSQEEYISYLSLAGEDFEKAIELEPYVDGSYYIGLYKYYDKLANLQTNRVDRILLNRIALDNLTMGNRLGNYDPLAERYVIFSNIMVGNCDAGIEQANKLIETETEPSPALYTGLALGYMCRHEPKNALPYMDTAITILDTCERRLERARILYVLNRIDDALADLDFTLSKDPYYCGGRYYLRGLIYAEKGELDKAQEDLYFGMGQTWARGGELSYAFGKIALAQGDTETAIQYFQEAEATYLFVEDPLLEMMRNDITSLGAAPLEIPPSFIPATPIPTQTLQFTPRPTSSPDASFPTSIYTPDPKLQQALIVDIEKQIGPIMLGWNTSYLWRFQSAESLDHKEVKSLSVWLNSSDTSQRLPRQLLIWNFRKNMWGSIDDLKWGENRAVYQNYFVSPDGDVIIYLVNQDNSLEAVIDSIGITLVLQRTDGSIEVHGITP
jgi:tetratricopeptide (TPR) repeat protein